MAKSAYMVLLVSVITFFLSAKECVKPGSGVVYAQEATSSPNLSSEKSIGKAILLSALIPGLGQIYIGEKRGLVTGVTMMATDAFAIWRYTYNRSEGDSWKKDYQSWGRAHYRSSRFWRYVRDTVVVYSGYEGFGRCTDPTIYDSTECWRAIERAFYLGAVGSDTYFDQIARDPIYIFGWDDWNPYTIPNHEDSWTGWEPGRSLPERLPQTTPNRDRYNHLRDMADKSYGRAEAYAWVMVVGRVVSMIDAAMMIKMRNVEIGSLELSPRVILGSRSGGKGFNLTLALRF